MSIYDKQNEKDMIGLLKAQRSLYNKAKAIELEEKINQILTGDENLDICTLLRILKSKVNNG